MPYKVRFRVTHASGQDDNFKASELNTHSPLTRGWQSARFCLYPQDIVVSLEKRTRIRKVQILSHQHLIASRIELFVGDVPPGVSVSLHNARYTRLGYIVLSDNEEAEFKARELKTAHVDAMGLFVKLVIHKNHVNRHNLYNQVGLVAVNVIGDEILEKGTLKNLDDHEERYLSQAVNKPDYVSPLDDLAFDMYQDPEVAQIIRKLEKKKQESVLGEKFAQAKVYKAAVVQLQQVGERLGKFEVEKRRAVEGEDYDRAKTVKGEMEIYRVQAYKDSGVHELLQSPMSNDGDGERPRERPQEPVRPNRLQSVSPELSKESPRRVSPRSPLSEPQQSYDDRPLPALKAGIKPGRGPAVGNGNSPRRPDSQGSLNSADLSLYVRKVERGDKFSGDDTETEAPTELQTETEEDTTVDPHGYEGDPMTEKDMRDAGSVIDTFGLPLVQKSYSKTWSAKEDSLEEMISTMRAYSGEREEAKLMFRSAVFLIHKHLKDQVYAILKAALKALHFVLTDYYHTQRLFKNELIHALEKTVPEILHRSGDTAPRSRNDSKAFVITLASIPDVQSTHIVQSLCMKPFKGNPQARAAQSRVEINEDLHDKLKVGGDSGLSLDGLMKFCVVALKHTSGPVRAATEQLIIALYRNHGSKVKSYLPPDDDRTRKNTLYRLLFEAFDKIDGKPSRQDLLKQQTEASAAKRSEVDALQAQLAQLRSLNNQQVKQDGKKKKTLRPPAPDDDMISNTDKQCIFCSEVNESFTDEGLDVHYWKSCPMLKRCSNCKQVVEVSGFISHLLSECESKDKYSQCPTCSEAILNTEFAQHTKENKCNPVDVNKARCPLCHLNISDGEKAWVDHLMGPNGCKQNPRRVTKGGGGKPVRGGGKAPQRAPARGARPPPNRK